MMLMQRKKLAILTAIFALVVISASFVSCERARERAAAYDRFPSRPIEVASLHGAGGGTELMIRSVAVGAQEQLGQNIVSVIVTGGAGMPAWHRFVTQPHDGHTLKAFGPEQVIQHVRGHIDMWEHLIPLVRTQHDVFVYFARYDDPRFPDVHAMMAYLRANPGTTIAGTNVASFDDVQINLFAMEMGIDLNYVPYPSAAEAFAAVLGGHTDLLGEEIGPAAGLIESGHLRPLVVFLDDRDYVDHPLLQGVPTSRAMGWSDEVGMGRWRGFAIGRNTDPEQVRILAQALHYGVQTETYLRMQSDNLLDIRPGWLWPEEFMEFIRREVEINHEVVSALGWD